MKRALTKENIKFIETYLVNSGVRYLDIRMEMLDHIATDIEATLNSKAISFYDAFKAYMVIHKKELLENNTKLYRQVAAKKVFKAFKTKFFSFAALSVFGILFFGLSILEKVLHAEQFLWVLEFFPSLIIGGAMVMYALSFRSAHGRYSVYETLYLCFLVAHFISQMFLHKKIILAFGTVHEFLVVKLIWSTWGLSVLLLLLLAYKLKQQYKFRFEN